MARTRRVFLVIMVVMIVLLLFGPDIDEDSTFSTLKTTFAFQSNNRLSPVVKFEAAAEDEKRKASIREGELNRLTVDTAPVESTAAPVRILVVLFSPIYNTAERATIRDTWLSPKFLEACSRTVTVQSHFLITHSAAHFQWQRSKMQLKSTVVPAQVELNLEASTYKDLTQIDSVDDVFQQTKRLRVMLEWSQYTADQADFIVYLDSGTVFLHPARLAAKLLDIVSSVRMENRWVYAGHVVNNGTVPREEPTPSHSSNAKPPHDPFAVAPQDFPFDTFFFPYVRREIIVMSYPFVKGLAAHVRDNCIDTPGKYHADIMIGMFVEAMKRNNQPVTIIDLSEILQVGCDSINGTNGCSPSNWPASPAFLHHLPPKLLRRVFEHSVINRQPFTSSFELPHDEQMKKPEYNLAMLRPTTKEETIGCCHERCYAFGRGPTALNRWLVKVFQKEINQLFPD